MTKKTGFILYLDLLGYKNILRSKDEQEETNLSMFVDGFIDITKLKSQAAEYYPEFDENKLLIRCFSDNFIIFYESSEIGLENLVISVFLGSILLGNAIQKGYMFRGSIVYGDIYYSESIVFGENIVKAYELECNHIEPNIVLSQELKKEYEKNGLYMEEIISPFSKSFNNNYEEAKLYFDGIKIMINRLNLQSIVDGRTIAKYEWLIKEFNRYFKDFAQITFANKPYHYDIEYSDSSQDI